MKRKTINSWVIIKEEKNYNKQKLFEICCTEMAIVSSKKRFSFGDCQTWRPSPDAIHHELNIQFVVLFKKFPRHKLINTEKEYKKESIVENLQIKSLKS